MLDESCVWHRCFDACAGHPRFAVAEPHSAIAALRATKSLFLFAYKPHQATNLHLFALVNMMIITHVLVNPWIKHECKLNEAYQVSTFLCVAVKVSRNGCPASSVEWLEGRLGRHANDKFADETCWGKEAMRGGLHVQWLSSLWLLEGSVLMPRGTRQWLLHSTHAPCAKMVEHVAPRHGGLSGVVEFCDVMWSRLSWQLKLHVFLFALICARFGIFLPQLQTFCVPCSKRVYKLQVEETISVQQRKGANHRPVKSDSTSQLIRS